MTGIQGKVVAITGASSGIGEATALELAGRGAAVVLGARREDRLRALAGRITGAGGRAAVVAVDVTRRADLERLVATAVDTFGRLDVLVGNAGIARTGPVDALDVDGWDAMIDVNVRGVLHGIAAALPLFRAQGRGHLVTIVSTSGLKIVPTQAVYAGTKNAVRTLLEALRQESTDGVLRTTSVSPGFVRTELVDHVEDAAVRGAMRTGWPPSASTPPPSPAPSPSRSSSPTTSRSATSPSARRCRAETSATRRRWDSCADGHIVRAPRAVDIWEGGRTRRRVAMPRQIITTPLAPGSPLYSQGVRAGSLVFVSGTTGIDPATGAFAGPTVQAQTRQALANCEAVLRAGGASLDDVVEVGVLLSSPDDFVAAGHDAVRVRSTSRSHALRVVRAEEARCREIVRRWSMVAGTLVMLPSAVANCPST